MAENENDLSQYSPELRAGLEAVERAGDQPATNDNEARGSVFVSDPKSDNGPRLFSGAIIDPWAVLRGAKPE